MPLLAPSREGVGLLGNRNPLYGKTGFVTTFRLAVYNHHIKKAIHCNDCMYTRCSNIVTGRLWLASHGFRTKFPN